jgi:hypothetical protein
MSNLPAPPPVAPKATDDLPTFAYEQIDLRWISGTSAAIWFLHPTAADLVNDPPYHHRIDTGTPPLRLLSLAIANSLAHKHDGPTIFLLPELTVGADDLSELRAITGSLTHNQMAIVGLGHLNQQQCEAVEPGTGANEELWRRAWSDTRFANGAAIATTNRTWYEAKDWPSKFEDDRNCHIPHSRLRIFQGKGIRFAVVICSELLEARNPRPLIEKLRDERINVLFWLQHNPKPRHSSFTEALSALYEHEGDHPLVIAINKQPPPGARKPYGGSAIYSLSTSFGAWKGHLLRPNFACEPLNAHLGISRAILVRYDLPAHRVLTIHPDCIPRGTAPAGFLRDITPYQLANDHLEPDDQPRHFRELLASGHLQACHEAEIDPNDATPTGTGLKNALVAVENELAGSANTLLNFLDRSLLPREGAKLHASHLSHSPAAACDCWPHRQDFDSLFEPPTPAIVAELALAIAALRSSQLPTNVDLELRTPDNLATTIEGGVKRLHLLSSDRRLDICVKHLATSGARTDTPPAIVLRSERKQSAPANAARIAPVGSLQAAQRSDVHIPCLSGSEFWRHFRNGTLAEAIRALYNGAE